MTDSGIRSVCFTGHRQIPASQGRPVVQALRREIGGAAGAGFTRFMPAVRWDSIHWRR